LERLKASVRAKVEHPLRVIKRQFGYVKVRYRGIAKNAAQVLTCLRCRTCGCRAGG
jgi:IS5 family transposase